MKSISSSREACAVSARSSSALQRGGNIPNSQSIVKPVDQKPELKQEENQEPSNVGTQLLSCSPTFGFLLFVMIYLVCAVIRFVHTDDGGMLTTILPYLAGYVGIPLITPLVPKGKNERNDQQD